MARKIATAYRIDLEDFIKNLMTLWEDGYDFVDLAFYVPENMNEEPSVKIVTKEEYLGPEDDDGEDEDAEETPPIEKDVPRIEGKKTQRLQDEDIEDII